MATAEHQGLVVGEATFRSEDATKLQMLIAELDTAVEQRLPNYRHMLAQIHSVIRNDPDQKTLLAPEDCAVIVKAMAHSKGILFEEKVAKAASKKGALKPPKGQSFGDML